jgi:hypothetical protein
MMQDRTTDTGRAYVADVARTGTVMGVTFGAEAGATIVKKGGRGRGRGTWQTLLNRDGKFWTVGKFMTEADMLAALTG